MANRVKRFVNGAWVTVYDEADIIAVEDRATSLETDVGTLQTEVETASTGLLDRTTALETDVGTLQTEVETSTTGLLDRTTALETGKVDIAGDTMTGPLRLPDPADVTLASTAHAFQIGADSAANIAMDGNEIMARNNGVTSTLYLNSDGGPISTKGDVTVSDTAGTSRINLRPNSSIHDQIQVISDTTNGRPYISFWNRDALGNLDRKGYIGYPQAASDSSQIHIQSDQGSVLIEAVTISGGDVTASTFNGLAIESNGDTAPGTNQILRSGTSGYVHFGWINTVSGSTTEALTRIYASQDQYIRYVTLATLRDQLIGGATIYPNKIESETGYMYIDANGTSNLIQTQSWMLMDMGFVTSGGSYMIRKSDGVVAYLSSDRALKENIHDLSVNVPDSGALIDALRPVTFNEIDRWAGVREGPEPPEAREWREKEVQIGFIADEVADVHPHLALYELCEVETGEFDEKGRPLKERNGEIKPNGWDFQAMQALLVAEVQQLRRRVTALEARP